MFERRKWSAAVLGCAVAGLLQCADAADVYLLGGQSNMQGIGKIANLPAGVPATNTILHAFFWNGEQFEPFVLGQTKTSTRTGEFGPELGFALEMATAEHPVYLIKYHVSGKPLHRGLDGKNWLGEEPGPGRKNFYPGETPGDANQGVLYAAMLARFQEGLAQLERPVVRSFLWMQGEQDSKFKIPATSYAASLKQLRERLAEDLALEHPLPLVFGQVLSFEPALEKFTYRDEIRAQMVVAGERGKHATMVSTDGFGMLPDKIHYSAAGQLRLGREFATAIKEVFSDESQ